VSRALPIAAAALAVACAPSDARPCAETGWLGEGAPPAIELSAEGAITWAAGDAPVSTIGTLSSLDPDGSGTTMHVATASGDLVLHLGVGPERLGVLSLGTVLEARLGDGIALLDDEGFLRAAVVLRRDGGDATAGSITFRQAYAECVTTVEAGTCRRVMAEPLVDVVTGASIVRLAPGSIWRIPDDESPRVEVEVVRSVRPPEPDELPAADAPLCGERSATELAVIVRHLH
jgi:hypothetical protein